ncbi:M48 family metallopeptidase [soil metagenome]
MTFGDRRQLVVLLVLVAVAFGLIVALTTPWQWLPGGELAAVDPTAGLQPEQLERISDYRAKVVPVGLLSTLAGLLAVGFLGFSGYGSRLVRRLPGGQHWWIQGTLAVAAGVLIGRLVTLPFAIRVEQVRHRFGLSTQPWADWASDVATSYAVSVVILGIGALLIVGLARRTRRWWLPASVLAAALVIAGSFVYPVLVEPLFARFTPMPAGELRTSLVELAARDDVRVDEVLVADASQRTTALNAYVSGFGATKRIVVYDTLLAQASAEEVRLIVAHELGHADNRDVLHGTLIGALGAVGVVALFALILESCSMRRTAGYAGPRDAAVVPAVLALVAVGSFFVSPLQNLISRAVEARADVHALELTRDVGTFKSAQRRLAVANLSAPDPNQLLYVWYASHPTVAQRIALAEGWSAIQQRSRLGAGGARVGRLARVGVAGVGEQVVGQSAQGEDREHDDRRDQCGEKSVLN